MNGTMIIEWTIVILIFAFAIYTMRIIKNEKAHYLKGARLITFYQFQILTPSWWTQKEGHDPQILSFHRTDTRYEWQSNFFWITENVNSDLSINDLFIKKIKERSLLFDEETTIITSSEAFKNNQLTQSGKFEMVRVEGTATFDKSERLYYDAFLAREKSTGSYLYAESKSSVLNGLVEGPYFEEVMAQIKINFS